MTAPHAAVPVEIADPINARILAVSEDRIAGFLDDPFAEIARLSGVAEEQVLERLRAMLEAGTIRRIRQTLMATNLAPGALVAWRVPAERVDAAFDYIVAGRPVLRPRRHPLDRRRDAGLGLPAVDDAEGAAGLLDAAALRAARRSASAPTAFRIMPAKRLFALGVGHVRRRGMEPGSRTDEPGAVIDTNIVELSRAGVARAGAAQARVRAATRSRDDPWRARADEAGVSLEEFLRVARGAQRARRDRPLLHLPRAREAVARPASA